MCNEGIGAKTVFAPSGGDFITCSALQGWWLWPVRDLLRIALGVVRCVMRGKFHFLAGESSSTERFLRFVSGVGRACNSGGYVVEQLRFSCLFISDSSGSVFRK